MSRLCFTCLKTITQPIKITIHSLKIHSPPLPHFPLFFFVLSSKIHDLQKQFSHWFPLGRLYVLRELKTKLWKQIGLWENVAVTNFWTRMGREGGTPYMSHIGMWHPKGMLIAPFWFEIGSTFQRTTGMLPWVPEVFLACSGNFRWWL